VLDFCDWMSSAAAAQIDDTAGVTCGRKSKACWRWRRPSALLSTISEREQDQDVVTLSTLHAAKGLEWPHVMLVGVTEGMLPFKLGDDATPPGAERPDERPGILQRLQEERRLMYVGITRAQRSLAVSWTRKRKKGREMVAAQPSRFIAEMALESATGRAISATWSGSFADQACGKEIRGTWTDTATRIERAFVLRKQPGWQ
jgi:ATP-dependent DNA helicase Rep